jgi:NhaP-type Na+/H+ or K+/H+ antiporter
MAATDTVLGFGGRNSTLALLIEASAGEEEHHRSLSVAAAALCACFVVAACVSDVMSHCKIQSVLPPSTIMICAGMLLGLLGTLDPAMQGSAEEEHGIIGARELPGYMQFNVEIFQFFLLPIIIFSSAYNLPDGAMRVFFVQLGRIVFFAVFGTVIAITVTGFGIRVLRP